MPFSSLQTTLGKECSPLWHCSCFDLWCLFFTDILFSFCSFILHHHFVDLRFCDSVFCFIFVVIFKMPLCSACAMACSRNTSSCRVWYDCSQMTSHQLLLFCFVFSFLFEAALLFLFRLISVQSTLSIV